MTRVFIDEFIDPFFEEIIDNYRNAFLRGQFFWCHFPYIHENLEIWRPVSYDGTQTRASHFQISSAGEDAFNRSMPLYNPKLETDEEFIVVRAKRRPIILITPSPEEIRTNLLRGGTKINRHLCLVAPLYSVIGKYGNIKFPQEFIDRVRLMEFPQFFFIPENTKYGIRSSILRLDSLQAVFENHLDPLPLKLSKLAIDILQGQIECFINGKENTNYETLRELLLNPD